MSTNDYQLRQLVERAERTDELVSDLERTLRQLKLGGGSVKGQVGGGSAGAGASATTSSVGGANLSNSERQRIRQRLLSIREKVKEEEKVIENQKQTIHAYERNLQEIKTKVRTQLLAIKQQVLSESARANPKEFRDEVVRRLKSLREQIVADRNSSGGRGGGLDDRERQHVISKLKEIRANVEDQQKTIQFHETNTKNLKETVRAELLKIRQQVLVESARANPKEFRDEVVRRLTELKEKLQKGGGGGASGGKLPANVASRIISELKQIRSDVLERENEHNSFKQQMKQKLLDLRPHIKQLEDENKALKRGGGAATTGGADRLPPKLQNVLITKLRELKQDVFKIETENAQLKAQAGADYLGFLQKDKSVTVVDMHSGGEPLRIVEVGFPKLSGNTLLEKRNNLQAQHDDFRQFLLGEPHGHNDMYGAVLTEPDDNKEADVGVIFLTNDGYSSMCGHGVLCVARYAVDFGKVDENASNNSSGTRVVRIQAPCGVVTCQVSVDANGKSSGQVNYVSSPSWYEKSVTVNVNDQGPVEVDISYGGTYYAIAPSSRFNLKIDKSRVSELINAGNSVSRTVREQGNDAIWTPNPDSKDLEFLYGTILTENEVNVTVFADGQLDRCPTGSGIQARLALEYAKGNIKLNQEREFVSIVGSKYVGSVVEELDYKGKKAIRACVTGEARYVGKSTLFSETQDALKDGFYVR